MYGYYADYLDYDEILKHYSQEEIFKIVFKEYPDFNKDYLSPFRPDKNPNCYFEWYKGRLLFKDYADVRRDCFQSIKDYFKLANYDETFQFIHDYFEINGVTPEKEFEKVKEKRTDTKFYGISVVKRAFEYRDNLFWKQYHITKDQLLSDFVFPISRFRFYSKKKRGWFISNPLDIAYAISGFDRAKKIYRPKTKDKRNKWLTNCTNDDVGNINNISYKENYLFITKSYKDHRVIRNEGYTNTIWFQNERGYPNDDLLFKLIVQFPSIFIFYDNDRTGINGSSDLEARILKIQPNKKVTKLYSPYPIFKDPASIVSNKSRSELRDILWKHYQV